VIPEAPFLFSIAGLSASLAGLAGLVAALRRGSGLRPIDSFRLREIVEFAFANILFCVGVVPLSLLLGGGAPDAVRVASVLALVYVAVSMAILTRRTRQAGIVRTTGWTIVAVSVVLANVVAAIATLLTGSIAAYEALLVVMLARPMGAFLLVLSSFESPSDPE
jgi:hypothetical protein